MDKEVYSRSFRQGEIPPWLCPVCEVGRLKLNRKSLIKRDTAKTLKDMGHPDWEPDSSKLVFACVFDCDNKNCREPVSCSGTGGAVLYEYYDENGHDQFIEDTFNPNFFSPPLILMDIPKKCPESVRNHLKESFALFYSDSGAALNCSRVAVEALLTELKVKRFTIEKKKRKLIMLHQRIMLLPKKYVDLRDILLAVKWLGNAGSHSGHAVSVDDVVDAYSLLEHILSSIYENKVELLKNLAVKINEKKGPLKR